MLRKHCYIFKDFQCRNELTVLSGSSASPHTFMRELEAAGPLQAIWLLVSYLRAEIYWLV